MAIVRKDLSLLGVPGSEMTALKISREFGQVGQLDPRTKAVRTEPATLLNRIVVASRIVDGLPVFSSYAQIGLTKDGKVGLLRVHWPDIPPAQRKLARTLQRRIKAGFKAPALKGAAPEEIAAGFIHSPLFSETTDVRAVIRVVYASTDDRHSKKPVLYLDANGREIEQPRVFLKPQPGPPTEPRPKSAQPSPGR
jgi:hypothetical protein